MPYSNAEAIYIHTYKKLKTHIVTCFLYADWETYSALVFGKYTYLLVQWEIQYCCINLYIFGFIIDEQGNQGKQATLKFVLQNRNNLFEMSVKCQERLFRK